MADSRRFDETETAQILERAAALEQTRAERSTVLAPFSPSRSHAGMTLQQLEDIGSDVGLRPEDIRAAARSVERGDLISTQRMTIAGIPIGVSRTITLDRAMSDNEWERLVVVLRDTFQARGKVRREGSFREWSNGNLHVLLEPTATGHQLRLSTRKGSAGANLAIGSMFTLMGMSMMIGGVGPTLRFIIAGLIALGGLSTIGYALWSLPKWAQRRATQMESLAEAATRILGETDAVHGATTPSQWPERTEN